jgi:uncharacterized protein YndB with AHSA1/START domain
MATTTISQSYPTTVEDLWDACTDAERLARWFGPVTGTFELGGRYRSEDNASGTITACDRPHAFELSWEFGDDVSQLVVTISPEPPDRARLTITHRGDVSVDFWRQYGPGAGGVGWDLALLGLNSHLLHGTTIPPELTPWMSSDEALDFIHASSRAWAEASVAAGTPEQEAREAQTRTAGFFGTAS